MSLATFGCQPVSLKQQEPDKVVPLKTDLFRSGVTATFDAEAAENGTVLSVDMQDSRAEPVSVVVEYLYLQLYEPKEPFPMNFTLESGGRNVFELSFPKEARLTNLDDVRFLIEMECANGSTKIGSSLVYVYSPQFTSSSSIDGQLLYLSVSHGIEGRTMQFRVTEMIRNGRNILRAAVSVDVPYGSNVPLNDLVDSLVDRVDGEVTLAYEYRLEPNRSWQKSTTSISL